MTIETHPLEPFLPKNAKILFLGSFPPPKVKWSMEFFYPNWINDFWRVMGLIFYGDKDYLTSPIQSQGGEIINPKKFDLEKIVAHCKEHKLAFYDTARKVCRLKDNASDDFLEIVEGTDVFALLEQMPECRTIVTTGGKASEELQRYLMGKGIEVKIPKVGEMVSLPLTKNIEAPILRDLSKSDKEELLIKWWRMPSTSRAYPMKLEKKAEYYRKLFV